MESNPILKYKQLPFDTVREQINNLATDAQWDLTNAKSPKGQRDAEERLNLFGSALFIIENAVKNPYVDLNAIKPEMKGDIEND